ncbi:MAG: porin [Deltaproteobacteria bacterium]|nr:porin [Deltaproteobacteria bacterium]
MTRARRAAQWMGASLLVYAIALVARPARAQEAPGAAPAPAPGATPARAEETPAKWYDRVKLGAFVDGHAGWNFANPKAGPLVGQNRFRGYDQWNGLMIHWVGFDGTVDPDPVGGGVSLRFGPSAALYTGSPDGELGLTNVKQAFVSYKPGGAPGKLQVVFGKFDTIYGAEVADSQLNVTYTRSMLNFYAQPFFHTGFRVDYQATDAFQVKVLAVNGWNNAVDTNAGKTLGVQAIFKPDDRLLAAVGWLGGPEQPDHATIACAEGTAFDRGTLGCVAAPGAAASDTVVERGGANRRFRHIVDFVVDWSPIERLRALFNFDWATEEVRSLGATTSERKIWWGADLTLRVKATDQTFVGLRGSYFRDRDGYLVGTATDTRVTSGTLTLGWMPTPSLVVKLEPRLDVANDRFFLRGVDGTSKTQLTTTLGIVAMTN